MTQHRRVRYALCPWCACRRLAAIAACVARAALTPCAATWSRIPSALGVGALAILVLAQTTAFAQEGERPPARVWINGRDLDRPEEGWVKPPAGLGFSLWPASISSTVNGQVAGGAPLSSAANSASGLQINLLGYFDRYRLEISMLTASQTYPGGLVLAGTALAGSTTLSQTAVAVRPAFEMLRLETIWGRHDLELGLRGTVAGEIATSAASAAGLSRKFMSPEIAVRSRWLADGTFGIHSRLSYAANTLSSQQEEAIEAQVALNYHTIRTHTYVNDISFGIRYLYDRLGFADGAGGNATASNHYAGPEVSYTLRF